MALQTCFALRLVAYLITVATTSSWLSDELEMFDLVEEVNKNFYDVLGINQVNNQLHSLSINLINFNAFFYYYC